MQSTFEVVADSEQSAVLTSSQPALSSPSATVDKPAPSPVEFAPAVVPTRHAKAGARTYGRRAPPADDASAVTAKDLAAHSTTVIPETDLPSNGDLEDGGAPEESAMKVDRSAESSSPSRRTEQSTDPTSEEDTLVLKQKPDLSASAESVKRVDGSDSGSSSDEDEGMDQDEDSGALAWFKNRKSIAEQIAEIDAGLHDDDSQKAGPVDPFDAFGPLDSTLTVLPTSEPASTGSTRLQLQAHLTDSTLTSLGSDSAFSDPLPLPLPLPLPDLRENSTYHHGTSSDSLLQQLEDTLPPLPELPPLPSLPGQDDVDMSDEEEVSRTAKPKSKPRRRILDSEDEDDDLDDHPQHPRSKSSVIVDDSPKAPELSKRDKIALLAQKRAPPPVSPIEQEARRVRSVSIASEEDSDSAARKKGKGKSSKAPKIKGALSKKAEMEMHKETAALQRNQDARLQPTVKKILKVGDIVKKTIHRPLVNAFPRFDHQPDVLTISSDSIESASDSPARPTYLSEKAQGKQRAQSPIAQTPIAARRVVPRPNHVPKVLAPATTPAPEEEEEGLLSLEQLLAKKRKDSEAKKFAEQKAAAAAKAASQSRSRRATTVLSDSDSDLEIQGAPASVRSRAFGTPGFDRASTPHAMTATERKIRELNGPASTFHHHDEDPSESQFAAAGHNFGQYLMPGHQIEAPRRRSKKGVKPSTVPINGDSLNHMLLDKAKKQSVDTVTKKRTAFRKQTNEQLEKERLGATAAVDVKAILAKKKSAMQQVAEQEEQEEQEADEDYLDEAEAEDSDAGMASGSEAGRRASSSQAALLDDEAGEDLDAERPAAGADDDHEEMPAPPVRGKKVRLQVNSEDEEDSITPAPAAPATLPSQFDVQQEAGGRIVIPGLEDEGGFSQFFDSQFSQDVGNVNDIEGFHRIEDDSAPAPTLIGHVFLDEAERAKDIELMEKRGNFHDVEPNTPREAPAPRQYINKQGLLTQTRPANLFGLSPADSPNGSDFSQLGSLPRTYTTSHESQMTQTQLAATQTPTQASKNPNHLRRAGALIGYDSYGSLPPTEIVREEEEEDDTQQESFPTAAQPTKPVNAFDILVANANKPHSPVVPVVAGPTKKQRSAFIDTEADMSDEEEGALGRMSGDEDETGMDAELDSLVDNEEVDRDLRDEQDEMVDELYAEDMAKKDAEELARAQRIADGKERNKRGALDLDDDDFDDDWGVSKRPRQQKQRVDNMTTAELTANEETQAFALHITEGLVTEVKAGEFDFLQGPEDAEDAVAEDEDEDDEMAPPMPRISVREATRLALEKTKLRQQLRERSPDAVNRAHPGDSSSPMPLFKLNHKTVSTTVIVPAKPAENFDDLDSQGILKVSAHAIRYKFDSRDESQGGTNGTTAGANSAVTSFAKNPKRTTSAPALGDATGKKGGRPLKGSGSSFGFRKGGFS